MTPRVFYRLLMKYWEPDTRTKMFLKNCLPPTVSSVCSLFCHGYTTMASLPWVSRLKGNLGLFSTPPMPYITIPYSYRKVCWLGNCVHFDLYGSQKISLRMKGWGVWSTRLEYRGKGDDIDLINSLGKKEKFNKQKILSKHCVVYWNFEYYMHRINIFLFSCIICVLQSNSLIRRMKDTIEYSHFDQVFAKWKQENMCVLK